MEIILSIKKEASSGTNDASYASKTSFKRGKLYKQPFEYVPHST